VRIYILFTRSYYRKENVASPPRDQRQHAQFAEYENLLAIATGHDMQVFNHLHYSNNAGLSA
jgi:hypothetical protein